MNLLNSALLVALDTGDYNETQHAISVLESDAKITDGGKESAIEIAARVLAKELMGQREWRHDIEVGLRALRFDFSGNADLARAQYAIADLRERAIRAEDERNYLRDIIAQHKFLAQHEETGSTEYFAINQLPRRWFFVHESQDERARSV